MSLTLRNICIPPTVTVSIDVSGNETWIEIDVEINCGARYTVKFPVNATDGVVFINGKRTA